MAVVNKLLFFDCGSVTYYKFLD